MSETIPISSLDTTFAPPTREVSVLALASTVLRRRRTILVVMFIGAFAGGLTAILSKRTYTSGATFLAQTSDQGNMGGLAAAASQLGIRVPAAGGGWSPALYAKIARSRSVLGPIAVDSFVVPEVGNRRMSTLDLLEIKGPTPEARLTDGVDRLMLMVQTDEDKALGIVRLTVTTPWPSFSVSLTQRLLAQINAFNVQTRRSQATAEREFADQQVAKAETALRVAENNMQDFMQGNRDTRAPHLTFERDRLQREVGQAQTLYTGLLQGREEARLREVRDTPVISVLEQPQVPLKGNSRGGLLKLIAGAMLGGLLAILVIFVREAFVTLRATGSSDAREFFSLLDQVVRVRAPKEG